MVRDDHSEQDVLKDDCESQVITWLYTLVNQAVAKPECDR